MSNLGRLEMTRFRWAECAGPGSDFEEVEEISKSSQSRSNPSCGGGPKTLRTYCRSKVLHRLALSRLKMLVTAIFLVCFCAFLGPMVVSGCFWRLLEASWPRSSCLTIFLLGPKFVNDEKLSTIRKEITFENNESY